MEEHAQTRSSRSRRWIIPLVIAPFLLIVGLLIAFAALRPQPYQPDRDHAAEFHALTLEHAAFDDPSENRWNLYQEILRFKAEAESQALAEHDTGTSRIAYDSIIDDDEAIAMFRPAALAAMEGLTQAGVFDLLAELARDPRVVPIDAPASMRIDSMLFNGLHLRELARAVDVRFRHAVAAGNVAAAITALESKAALAKVSYGSPTLISHLIGLAIDGWVQRDAIEVATMPNATRADIDRIMAIVPSPPDIEFAIKGERLWALDQIRVTPPSPYPLIGVNPRREATAINEYFDLCLAHVRGETTPQLRAGETINEWADQRFRLTLIAKMIAPAMGGFIQAHRQSKATYAGNLTCLALEAFRAEHGQYPAALNDLTPHILAELPASPFDPSGLVYRLPTAEDTLDGRAYLLYSIGADGLDNGGLVHPEGEHLGLVKDKGSGYDFVFGR